MAKPYVPYTGPIVTCAEAKAQGLKRYFPGSKCRRMGHVSERFTSTGNCIACVYAAVAAYSKAHPEKSAARQAQYRQRHPERPLAYRQANKEKLNERGKVWKRANPDKVRANTRKWHKAHPQVVKNWRKANPEAWRAQVQTRKALMANAEGRHTGAELKALMEQQRGRCAYCRKSIKTRYSVDHIEPLSRGGSNWITNIQLLCQSCNSAKQDADPVEYARRIGLLI